MSAESGPPSAPASSPAASTVPRTIAAAANAVIKVNSPARTLPHCGSSEVSSQDASPMDQSFLAALL